MIKISLKRYQRTQIHKKKKNQSNKENKQSENKNYQKSIQDSHAKIQIKKINRVREGANRTVIQTYKNKK